MPLLTAQKQLIEATISHLLDFSTQSTEFAKEESDLTTAFMKAVDKDHPYYWLRECFIHPTKYFQRLEQLAKKQEPPPTIGEVQKYMIDFISSRLALSNHTCIHWNRDNILKTIPKKNNSIRFVTKLAHMEDDSEHPYAITNLEGKIFTCMMELEESYDMSDDDDVYAMYQPFVNVTVTCGKEVYNKKIALGKKVPETQFRSEDDDDDDDFDANQDVFIEDLKPKAVEEAEIFAAQCALPHLRKSDLNTVDTDNDEVSIDENDDAAEEEILDESSLDEDELSFFAAVRLIVTNQFYFEQLQKNISLQDIITLTKEKAECLINPTIIKLIQNNILSFKQATALLPWQVKLITHPTYNALLLKKEIGIRDTDIIKERANFLITPPIANLIQMGKLSFSNACKLFLDFQSKEPIDFKSIVMSPLYDGFFSSHDIPWQALFKLNKHHCVLLLQKNIARLIVNGSIDIKDIPKLSPYMTQAIPVCPRLFYWLEQKFISLCHLTEYDQTNFHHLYVDVYSMRFKGLFNNDPFKINGQIDTVQSLIDELPVAAVECGCSLRSFKQSIAKKLILAIKVDIETILSGEKISTYNPTDTSIIWKEFLAEINNSQSAGAVNWLRCLTKLIDSAKYLQNEVIKLTYLDDISNFNNNNMNRLFSNNQQTCPPSSPIQRLQSFCNNLINLSSLDSSTAQMNYAPGLKNSS